MADCFVTRCHDLAKARKTKWRIHQDYRKLLDEKDIDAVIVATPDHGRVLACILACQAGKDIYAEKPLSLYIREGRLLVEAVQKYGRVVQVGSQQRSMEMNRFACEFVRTGGIGKIRRFRPSTTPAPIAFRGWPCLWSQSRTDSTGIMAGPSGIAALQQPAGISALAGAGATTPAAK